ncbi:Filament-forming protein, partial [Coemansia sp. RSA 2603]
LQACQQAVARVEAQRDEAREAAGREARGLEEQLHAVRRQNALLLAHLEALGRDVPDVQADPELIPQDDSDERGLRDVVVYLRRERDLAAAQLEAAQQEAATWRQQATHTQHMLDDVRAELMQYVPDSSDSPSTAATSSQDAGDLVPAGDGPLTLTAAQRQACRRQLEQTAILRESNGALRSDLKSARAQLTRTEAELRQLRDQQVPELRAAHSELTAQLEASQAHAAQLADMCAQWKSRHENIVTKYQMIEPEDHEALKQRVGELEAQRRELLDKAEAASAEASALRGDVERVSAENQALLRRIEQAGEQQSAADARRALALQSEAARLRQHAAEAEAQAAELRSSLEVAEKSAAAGKAKYDKLHAVFQKLRAQSVEKLDQSAAAIKAHEATIVALQQQLEAQQQRTESQQQQTENQPQQTENQQQQTERMQEEMAALVRDKDEALAAHQKLAADLEHTQAALDQARAQLAATSTSTTTTSPPAAAVTESAQPADASVTELRAALSASETKVRGYEAQLEEIKARALKYARDNKTLQTRAAELQHQLEQKTHEVELLRGQLADAEARVEQVRASAKSSAELRAKLQISQANKRVEEMKKQLDALHAAGKRPAENDIGDAPAKKQHVE